MKYFNLYLEQAQSLEGEDRKDYAEKVAFAFMEALGIQDGDDNDDDNEDRWKMNEYHYYYWHNFSWRWSCVKEC